MYATSSDPSVPPSRRPAPLTLVVRRLSDPPLLVGAHAGGADGVHGRVCTEETERVRWRGGVGWQACAAVSLHFRLTHTQSRRAHARCVKF